MSCTILQNAKLILPEQIADGHVVLEAGRIVSVEFGKPSAADHKIDCEGDYLAPGLIELHTDNLERHLTPRPGVDWPHGPAIMAHDSELAGCGITTVFDAMRVGSVSSREDFQPYARTVSREVAALQRNGLLKVSHHLHLRCETCSDTLLVELGSFDASDRIGLVSLMDHTPGQRQYRSIERLKRHICASDTPETDAYIQYLLDLRAQHGATHDRAVIDFARMVGAVLASHDDTTVEHVNDARDNGGKLSEFPTTLEAARACRDAGLAIILGAPNLIRGGSHSGNVSAEGLARAGLLDVISSDYIPSGLLNATLHLARLWHDLPRAFATVSLTPAKTMGLMDRGRIAAGLRGDLIRLRMSDNLALLRETWVEGVRVA